EAAVADHPIVGDIIDAEDFLRDVAIHLAYPAALLVDIREIAHIPNVPEDGRVVKPLEQERRVFFLEIGQVQALALGEDDILVLGHRLKPHCKASGAGKKNKKFRSFDSGSGG